jgi:hypothetical protein
MSADAARNAAIVGILVAAPVTLIIIVGMIRGYTFNLRMFREERRRHKEPPDPPESTGD